MTFGALWRNRPIWVQIGRIAGVSHLPPPVPLEFGPSLHNNVARIELSILVTVIATLVTSDFPRLSPRKVVEMPEGICREDKVPNGQGEKVDKHPSYIRDFPRGDYNEQTRETEDNTEKDKWDGICLGTTQTGVDDEIDGERDGSGEDQSSGEFHENDKLHREAEGTAKITNEDKFSKIVNGRVNPSSSLGEKDAEPVGHNGLANGLRTENHLSLGESLEHQGCQVSILS